MKKLLVLLFSILLLPLSVNAADVYYCSDDDKTGFDPGENYKNKSYSSTKFKIMIDFENNEVISKELHYYSGQDRKKCITQTIDDTLYCINDLGNSFSINKTNFIFHRSKIFNNPTYDDDIFVAYGSCEKF